MTDGRMKAARTASPDALLLPHVIEAIATSIDSSEDFTSFVHAVPQSLWTPALAAFLALTASPPASVEVAWPSIVINDTDLPSAVLAQICKTLPLRPQIEIECTIQHAEHLSSIVPHLGASIHYLSVEFDELIMIDGQGRQVAELLLQCPNLWEIWINVLAQRDADDEHIELSDLLAVIADPIKHANLGRLTIDLQHARATPRLGHLLATWLTTAPRISLHVENVISMDEDAAMVFCDALQANTALEELILLSVTNLSGFHGRKLPASLRRVELSLEAPIDAEIDDVTIESLATALGSTHLDHFSCNVFGQLVQCSAAAPMFRQLSKLEVSALQADGVDAFLAGLSHLPALQDLAVVQSTIGTRDFATLLMETLVTTCPHLQMLRLDTVPLSCDAVSTVLAGVPRLPCLKWLNVSPRSTILPADIFYVLPELIAAGRHVRDLLFIVPLLHGDDELAVLRVLALVRDVPFFFDKLPLNADAYVVDALGAQNKQSDRCRLRTSW
ncbi:hypothetical protein SPRG_00078 [Saprolegnia parasitica CBS 223.65]|uniref:F-box domain-containing protein n=1 Tax=Saprolegnia parasitica (strain CBS 223.65) TaxID=695850 RepID=A0A067CXN1_SAPPC|nr:hypothetical protein SPRG_00078 [Saprolegnia parasitica CBS 223.65]KDO35233.1 hypothetical protein SPRG_00078 [Saprolegnia parasitica CBS 223.65]|eukprot:XP_012193584.1 hypothetical protein SPRG_00078 [Saprolegnia parasitica CBS 223.65]